jgi:hypothetical protein
MAESTDESDLALQLVNPPILPSQFLEPEPLKRKALAVRLTDCQKDLRG